MFQFITMIGAIGIFLYGMKLMSEGLQKIAGDRLRSVLASMTSNRFSGMLTGVLVTALVQSSSATTVMIVSFVNAGLISLAESMAVIMGANVGTTATTWIIATVGFKFNIAAYILPLIAIALPFFNSTNSRRNAWGEFLIGFALLFLGLEVLKGSVPDISTDYPALLDALVRYSSWGFGSVCLFVLIGCLLTIIVQASSAAFTIALLMCQMGWISFEMGCALVLGSNIGTCITPVLASLSANTMAKRAAVGHTLFNVVGTLWTLALYYPFCRLIAQICLHLGLDSPYTHEGVSLGMTMFHTVFNVINLCLMLPFTKQFVNVVIRLIPEHEDNNKAFKIQHISKGLIASGELALAQVKKETIRYAEEVYSMFGMVRTMLNERLGSEKQLELYQRVKDMEQQSDDAEVEIAQFLNEISPQSLSIDGEQMSRSLYKMVDELESIADSMYHMAATLRNKCDQRVFFTPQHNKNVARMIELTEASLSHMVKVIACDQVSPNALNKAYNLEDEINNFRAQLRNEMLDNIDQKMVQYQQNTYFMELISECERIGDYVINVLAAQSQR